MTYLEPDSGTTSGMNSGSNSRKNSNEIEKIPSKPRRMSGQGSVGLGEIVGESDKDTTQELQRGFKARHIQMIAMASNIGTGLFVASGTALHRGGPANVLISYGALTISLLAMMQAMTEMTVLIPIPGGFTRYYGRFIDPALQFALGWLYWGCWVGAFAAECVAATAAIHYWAPGVHKAIIAVIFIAVNVFIHVMPVWVFAEVEFSVSTMKVLTIAIILIMSIIIIAGGSPSRVSDGAQYWEDPGAFQNGFKGLCSVFVLAAFSCGGTEITGSVSGETKMPRFTLPRGIKTFVFRMVFFYLLALLFISFCVPSDDERLQHNISPFVVAALRGGIKGIPDVFNAVVLIAVTSVASCSVYLSSRTIVSLAEDGMAPKIFARVDRKGRPQWALLFCGAVAILLVILSVVMTSEELFQWLFSLSGMTFFFLWGCIIYSNMRFRMALKAQGDDALEDKYNYKSNLYPFTAYFGIISFIFMVGAQIYVASSPLEGKVTAPSFLKETLPLILLIVLFGGWKITKKTKFVSLKTMDLQTGRLKRDNEEEAYMDAYKQRTRWQRFVSYLPFISKEEV